MSLLVESEQQEAQHEPSKETFITAELHAEVERQKGVENYLIQRLPETERRIEKPQDPDCKMAVVIPAYAEGSGILRPLASLATQESITSEEFETIIIVNQASELPERTIAESEADYERKQQLFKQASHDNEQTFAIISAIQAGIIPEGLDDAQRAACQKIIDSGIRIHAIDKFSEDAAFTPDQANVGNARDRGVAEAIERFFARRIDGIIAQSDADVAFDSNYLATLVKTFEQDPAVVGIVGRSDFEKLPEIEAVFPEVANRAAELYQGAWNRLLFSELGVDAGDTEAKEEVHFVGCTMSSRAYGLALVGGVPRLAGGEDTILGANLQSQGKVISQPDAVVHPLARFSARTEVGAGHGQRLLAAAESYASGGLMVSDPESIAAYVNIRRILADNLGDRADTMPMLTSQGSDLLDAEEMSQIREVAARSTSIDELLGDASLKNVRDMIQSRLDTTHRPIPIAEATHRIIELVMNNDEAKKQAYDEQVQKLLLAEERQIERRAQLVEEFYSAAQGKDLLKDSESAVEIIESLSFKLGLSAEQLQQTITNNKLMDDLIDVAQQATDANTALNAMKARYQYELTAVDENDLLQISIQLSVLNSL